MKFLAKSHPLLPSERTCHVRWVDPLERTLVYPYVEYVYRKSLWDSGNSVPSASTEILVPNQGNLLVYLPRLNPSWELP